MSKPSYLRAGLLPLVISAGTASDSMTSSDKRVLDLDAATRQARESAEPPRATIRLTPTNGVPADAPQSIRRWHASVSRGRPAVLLADAPLPEGAVARVVRDPAAPEPRLIVVSREGLDDELLALALHALRQSEINTPELSTAREIVLWRDRRVRVIEGQAVREGRLPFNWLAPGLHRESDALLRRAASGETGARRGGIDGVLVRGRSGG